MKRRSFLKTAGSIIAASTLPKAASAAVPASSRVVLPMNRNWRYHPAKVVGAEASSFDDSAFTTVVLPHSNIQLPWHNFDDALYEFISTYRRHFRYPAQARGKRVFVDFEGAMTASTVWINGVLLGEYKGGFTPFSFELTPHLRPNQENVLVVQLDSTERADIPPFGYEIDYMTFGGIYREVSLRMVPTVYLDNLHAQPKEVLTSNPWLEVTAFLAGRPSTPQHTLEVALLDGETVIAHGSAAAVPPSGPDPNASMDPAEGADVHASTETTSDPAGQKVALRQLKGIGLWDIHSPRLYTVRVRLLEGGTVVDEDTRRIGFREATFTDQGFSINGKIVKLRGLDRHQTFPFAGQAMPARVQRRDADILRTSLHCNIVRTSHYPQSRHFLDRCDELGLLVLEEIPGWQHIGPEPWKQISIDNVGRMIRRDWNHPSIILWGVRINESKDDHDFYTRTNALAHALDTGHQTGGIRYFQSSEFLEDVFTMNDFGFPLLKPNHPKYLNTEFVGHTFPTKTTDNDARQREHTLRYARIYNQLYSDPQYAGGIGWCAFDYNTHANFGSGDRICYHGVCDIFREPKPAAGFYKSQCDPGEEIVLEPALHWARGDEAVGLTKILVCSNCDHLKFSVRVQSLESNPWVPVAECDPAQAEFPHLPHAPFLLDYPSLHMDKLPFPWGDLRIDGYLKGQKVITKSLSGRGIDQQFLLLPDDSTLLADGADTTRVVLRVTDEFGAVRTYADDAIELTLSGPADLIGSNPFSLVGGTGAVWVRARQQSGPVTLTAKHPVLGLKTVQFDLTSVPPEAL